MISNILPKESWVAKWNGIRDCKPGIYAISVPMDEDYEEEMIERNRVSRGGGRSNYNEEYDSDEDKDFVVEDGDDY